MTIIPDSSVPITTGTAPDLGPINPSVGHVQGASAPATGLFPKPEYAPRVEKPKNYRPAEFGISEAVWGGMLQTAWAAAMMANDMPAFEVVPNYDAEAELIKMEQELRYQVQDDDRRHLLRSRSPGEFMYRQFQLDEKARGLQAMAARPVLGVLGAAADVDIALGYGIGAASRIAGASRAATMANLTVGTGAGTAGTYAYAGDRAPFNTADAATHVALSSSLAFLYGTGFKYAKKGEETPPVPNTSTDGTSADSSLSSNIPALESGLAGVGRSGDTSTVNREAIDSMDVDGVRYSEMKALRGARLTEQARAKVQGVIDSAFGKPVFASVLRSNHIHILESADQLPRALQDTAGTHIYDPATDTLFIMGDKLTKDNARTVMMQGIGVSVGLERVLGTATYDGLIDALESLAKNGDTNASAALAGAKGKDYLRAENALADYIGKSDVEVGLVREVLAKIKTYLKDNLGMDVDLTKEDIVALIQSSTKRVLKKPQLAYPDDTTHVWAGSAAQFDEFDTSFVGTGEGNVLQGWGLYGSADKNIADWYRIKETSVRGMPKTEGGLYRAKLTGAKSSDFLAWESTTQSRQVKAALQKAGIPTTGTGKEIYFNLMATMPGDTALAKAKAASEYLYSLGIKGNKYPTGKSKQSSSNTNNYVFFSDRDLSVDRKYVNDTEVQPLRITTGREANKRIVADPENATDDDILKAIEDFNDDDFKDLD